MLTTIQPCFADRLGRRKGIESLPASPIMIGLVVTLIATGVAPASARSRYAAHDVAPSIQDLIVGYAHDNDVPVGLAEAVVRIESNGNPRASNHGALGLMQVKPDTARGVGFDGSPSGLLTADTNLRFGMRVLAQAYRTSGGDVCRALAFYQSGRLVNRYTAAQRGYCAMARAFMAKA